MARNVFDEFQALEAATDRKQRSGDRATRGTAGAEKAVKVMISMTPTQRDRLKRLSFDTGVAASRILANAIDEKYEAAYPRRGRKTKE